MHLWEAVLLLLFSLTGWVCACWALWRMDGANRGRESAIAELRYVSESFARDLETLEARERRWADEMEGWRAYIAARVAADLGTAVERLASMARPEASHVECEFGSPETGEHSVIGSVTTLLPAQRMRFERATFEKDQLRVGFVCLGDNRRLMVAALAERLSRDYANRLADQLGAIGWEPGRKE